MPETYLNNRPNPTTPTNQQGTSFNIRPSDDDFDFGAVDHSKQRPPTHSRSHSHHNQSVPSNLHYHPINSNHYQLETAKNQKNWTSLIPPMPKPKPSLQVPNNGEKSQRHSIAISPILSRHNFDKPENPSPGFYTKSSPPFNLSTPPLPRPSDLSLAGLGSPPGTSVPASQNSLQTPQMFTHTNNASSPALQKPLDHPFKYQQRSKTTPVVPKRKKTCQKCNLEITGQFVRALSHAYHVECFKCHECGQQCSAKFFPYEYQNQDNQTVTVALCEYDYFKKLDLICFNCQNALRGPYITALGNKYHLEHFKCAVCQKVFESDESYYEHNGSIYCHYHYSLLFASRCEGCNSSIVKQFVELFRGGRNQQWHPECYMVHKFWNVCITADSAGLKHHFGIDTLDNLDPNLLLQVELQVESVVMNCWLTLSGYEENSASCISDMLLNACTGNQLNGIMATGKLILNVEVLFKAIDTVQSVCDSINQESGGERNNSVTLIDDGLFQHIRKEPRNISGKIMSYLALLRKSNQISASGSLSAELLSVITGCAHYLKLLIRIGLNNALKVNKIRGNTEVSDLFLLRTRDFEQITDVENWSHRLEIPHNATDLCVACLKSIEKACICLGNKRWHLKCMECSSCQKPLTVDQLNSYGYSNGLVCESCKQSDAVGGFEVISDLSQLIYLLKIALSRSKAVMLESGLKVQSTSPSVADDYSQTLNDVTRMRTKRQSQKLSNSVKKNARKSVIIEAPEAARAKTDITGGMIEEFHPTERKGSQMSFNANQHDHDIFKVKEDPSQFKNSLRIREEPQRQATNTHLDRTSDLLKNEKSLTLDDIPRIVAAEQAREQRPNAFKHHNSLYGKNKPMQPVKTVAAASGNRLSSEGSNNFNADSKLSKKSKYYSELNKDEHYVLRHIAVQALLDLRPNKFSKDELLTMIQQPKKLSGGFWDKFKFGNNEQKTRAAVFGADLLDLTQKYGVDSDLGVGPSKLRIPIVVDDCINALRQKDMSVEGIFRLNGNIKKLREMTEQINKNPLKSPDFSSHNAVQLAALMKKWLRELPDPLLTFNLYDLWISSQREQDTHVQKRIILLCYCMLPRSHRNLVEVLLYFFSWVASFAEIDEETGSKMDIHNLATVISPNILYSKPVSATDQPGQSGETYFLGIEVVNQMIEMHEELSVIPEDLLQFSEKCNITNTSTKEIMNKIEKVHKENADSFKFEVAEDEFVQGNNTVTRGHSKVYTESHGETSNI